jgi:signal transduction histidine kinase/DNA-binding response OmpR family regulator/ligand-binding sensor domain-containing protein
LYISLIRSLGTVALVLLTVAAHGQTLQFEHLDASNGLSQGMVFDLLQDRKGFLWAATKDGLNRYDGYTFKVFQNSPYDVYSISDNEVQSLLEDHLGRLWVGTINDGLNVMDPANGRFYKIKNLSDQSILCLTQSPDGAVWAGTANGVNRVRIPDVLPPNTPDLGRLAQVDTLLWEPQSRQALSRLHYVYDLVAAPDGKVWVASPYRFGYFEGGKSPFHTVRANPEPGRYDTWVTFFRLAPDGAVWIGQPDEIHCVRNGALRSLKLPRRSPFTRLDFAFGPTGDVYVSTRKSVYRLSGHQGGNAVPQFSALYEFPEEGIIGSTKMLVDRSGLLWIGTNGYGLLKHNPGNPNFKHFLKGKSPRRISVDRNGRLWVWLADLLFRRLDEAKGELTEPLLKDPQLWQHDVLFAQSGDIWVLCEDKYLKNATGYLLRLNGQTRQETQRLTIPMPVSMYSTMCADAQGNLWIAGNKSGLARFEVATQQFAVHRFGKLTGNEELTLGIRCDANGHFWVGTPHGLVQAVPEGNTLRFRVYKNIPEDRRSLSLNFVLATVDDPQRPDQYLWVGTKGGGLNRMDKKTGAFEHFTTGEGLPNNVVYSILPDASGALWVSTNYGLSKFSPAQGLFQNYFAVDGLQENEFNTFSAAQRADGCLYFGGVNGISAFHPARLDVSTPTPPVYITGLRIANQPLAVDGGPLSALPENTDLVRLSHDQNQLGFEFAALDFSAPRMNQYRYRLLGVERDWVEATTANFATYANLAPGSYVFEVITGGSRGIWNYQPARITVHIAPPWWRSTWAYALYAALIGGLLWWGYRFEAKRIYLENKLRYEQREASRLVELDQMKSNFFSSVTHEFRTPLTLLLEPTRQLLQRTQDETQRYRLELIERNAQRLLQFVNQLLDLTKLEAGQMPLDLQPVQPSALLQKNMYRFAPMAEQLGVELHLHAAADLPFVLLDEPKCDQILSNLSSNALKFSKKGGVVSLCVEMVPAAEPNWQNLRLSVEDSGEGIAAADLPHVFDRFFQTKHTRGGSGIGLALSKELAERMGGSISVESTLGKGAKFELLLPVQTSAQPPKTPTDDPATASNGLQPLLPEPPLGAAQGSAQPLLLLVEDNIEMRAFIRASLPAHYRIAEAADGAEGLQMAQELVPDLLVSDLMMPHKDGFELLRDLRAQPSSSHIPVLLLTAKSTLESRIEGLRHGADAYLTKPFRADELVAQIENLLQRQQRMQALFHAPAPNGTIPTETAEVPMLPPAEQAFINQMHAVLEQHLDDDRLDAEALARLMFLSRSQLHRKVSALTGLPLMEFVRNYRLDRARDMLRQNDSAVAEVAWRTGFGNAKYFSTCYRERFGHTPSSEKVRK